MSVAASLARLDNNILEGVPSLPPFWAAAFSLRCRISSSTLAVCRFTMDCVSSPTSLWRTLRRRVGRFGCAGLTVDIFIVFV